MKVIILGLLLGVLLGLILGLLLGNVHVVAEYIMHCQ